MRSGYGSPGGGLPVWATVCLACLGGGFAAGAVEGLFPSSSSPMVSQFAPAAVAGVIVGVALYLLLPSLSSATIGLGTAVLAGFSGAMVGLVTSRVLGNSPSSWLVATVASVLLISWMVSGSAKTGSHARPFQQKPKSWSEIEAMDRQGMQMEHDQAERGYWGSMQDPDPGTQGDS